MTDQNTDKSFSDYVLEFELALRGDQARHYDATINVLDCVQRLALRSGLADSGVPAAVRDHWYTRLAAGLTRVITEPSTVLTMDQLRAVCRRKQTIAYIFNASGYRNMRHILPLLGRQVGDDVTLSLSRLAVFYAFAGLDDINQDLMSLALKQNPEVLLILMLGWLNQRAVLTERGEKNRAMLLQSGPLIEAVTIADADIEQIVNAWMYTSYASEPQKHAIKKSFNQLLLSLMECAGVHPAAIEDKRPSRPRMIVVLERFTQPHAMFRCYARPIADLRRHFELIAISEAHWIDDAAEPLFDRIIRLEEKKKNIHELTALIQSLKPQMVYYPSLGMSHWTVMLAQLRLARVQIMSHGHPGTSMSPMIDYVYVCELEGDLAAINSEKVLVGNQYGAFAPHSALPTSLPSLVVPSDREVRVAVNSKVMKLSHRLLDICRKLIDNAEVPVRFSFFPGERGLFFDGLCPAIQAQLPEATVVKYIGYEEFLQQMCRCDLALAAFPFGNTNSTVDTCLLGLPTLAHFGPESPAQTDRMVLKTAGYPEWLIARSDEEYYEKALRLINEPELRAEMVSGVSRESARARLFNFETLEEGEDPFADMFWHVYQHHEELQAMDQRVFHYSDVLDTDS